MKEKNYHLIILMVMLLAPVPELAHARSGGTATAEVMLFPDGWVDVTIAVELNETSSGLIIRIDGEPHDLMVINERGIPLNHSLDGSFLIIETLGSREILISYETPSLTSKSGVIWNLTLDLDVDRLTVIVPPQLVIMGLSRLPKEISQSEKGLEFKFSGGSVTLSYKVAHSYPERSATTWPPSGTGTGAIIPKSNRRRRIDRSNPGQASSIRNFDLTQLLLPAISGILLAVIVSMFILRGKRVSAVGVEEDSLEYEIIKELERRGGKAKQADIIKAVQAPRTTVWRKIRRLEERGILEVKREGEVTVVRMRVDPSSVTSRT